MSHKPTYGELEQRVKELERESLERKRAEEALRESEGEYRSMLDSIGDAYTKTDLSGTITYLNKAASKFLGYSEEEFVGMNYKEYTSPENVKKIFEICNRVYRTGEPAKSVEFELIAKDGTTKTIEATVELRRDKLGKPIGFKTLSWDITKRKRMEESLRLTQFAVDHSSDAAFWMGPDAHLIYVNEAACHSLGFSREELLKMSIHDIDPDFPQEVWPEHWAEVKRRGSSVVDSHHRTKDGRIFPVEISVNYLEFDGKEFHCSFARDITERKRMEEALRESEERYRTLVETMKVGLIERDKNYVYTYANEQVCDMLGYSMDEIIGHSVFDLMDEENRKIIEDLPAKRKRIGRDDFPYELTLTRKDGQKVHTIVSPTPNFNADGHYKSSFAIITDITERKRIEERLKEANRRLIREMREREEFLRIVSHDLGAPVRNISGMAASIIRKYGQGMDDDVKDRLARVQRNAEHELGLIGDLLELSRIKTRRGCFEEVDLGALVRGVGDGLSNQLEEKGIRFRIIENPPTVFCERNRMVQVFQNLIDNACKYMDGNKNPRIEVGFEELEDSYRFSVSDNGIGIREEDQERIFYVFNRVRNPVTSQVEGKGVGLSAVKAIVEAYGGEVWVESPPGGTRKGKGARGSRFYFTLAKEALGRRASDEGRGEHSVGG